MRDDLRISGRGAVPGRHRVPAFVLSRRWGEEREEGGKRKQEKGTVSRHVPNVCLHIVFSGDSARRMRDMLVRTGGDRAFLARDREICGYRGGAR